MRLSFWSLLTVLMFAGCDTAVRKYDEHRGYEDGLKAARQIKEEHPIIGRTALGLSPLLPLDGKESEAYKAGVRQALADEAEK